MDHGVRPAHATALHGTEIDDFARAYSALTRCELPASELAGYRYAAATGFLVLLPLGWQLWFIYKKIINQFGSVHPQELPATHCHGTRHLIRPTSDAHVLRTGLDPATLLACMMNADAAHRFSALSAINCGGGTIATRG